MKIPIDVNLSPLWVPFLEANGLQAVHWSTIGSSSAPDSEILDHASREGFVVFTHDLDFGTLLAQRRASGPSVIQVRCQDVLPVAIGEIVVRAISASSSHLESGALVTVEATQHRIRILPIVPQTNPAEAGE